MTTQTFRAVVYAYDRASGTAFESEVGKALLDRSTGVIFVTLFALPVSGELRLVPVPQEGQ